jgi:polyhydroxyalkanoate synthesis regulator phasin
LELFTTSHALITAIKNIFYLHLKGAVMGSGVSGVGSGNSITAGGSDLSNTIKNMSNSMIGDMLKNGNLSENDKNIIATELINRLQAEEKKAAEQSTKPQEPHSVGSGEEAVDPAEVAKILEKMQKGEALTAAEAQTLQKYLHKDVKKPPPPEEPNDIG